MYFEKEHSVLLYSYLKNKRESLFFLKYKLQEVKLSKILVQKLVILNQGDGHNSVLEARFYQKELEFFWVLFVKVLVVCNSWDLLHGLLDIDLSSVFSFCEDHSQEHFLGPQNMEMDRKLRRFQVGMQGSRLCETSKPFQNISCRVVNKIY